MNDRYDGNFGNGVSLGQSQGISTDYIKTIPQGQLHVHAPNGIITGANLNGQPISNYDACMLDLQSGTIHKDTGNF